MFSQDIISSYCNLFVTAPSPVTAEELKCHKSLEPNNYFLCGWVNLV